MRSEGLNTLASRKRRLPTPAAAACTGTAAKRVLRSSVMLLVLSEHRWLRAGHQQRSKPPRSSEKPRAGVSQIGLSFVLAAEGALVAEDETTIAAVTRQAPFIDDGKFDPRRDYWGNISRTAGDDSMATTPANSNWAAGEIRSCSSAAFCTADCRFCNRLRRHVRSCALVVGRVRLLKVCVYMYGTAYTY